MKNILIVSYYFEPYNIVASRRPESWATFLSVDYNVTVLTRSWTGNEDGLNDIMVENKERSATSVNNNLDILRIPYVRGTGKKTAPGNRVLKKLSGYYKHYFGKFSDVEFIEENFEKEIQQVIKEKQINLVIYTCNPYLFLLVSKRIYKATGVKYIIDFRDILSEIMLKKTPVLKELLYQKIMAFRLKHHIKTAAALITVSEPLNKILTKIFKGRVYTIYNGFDKKIFDDLQTIRENEQLFNITYTGNLSPAMDIDVFLRGMQIFTERCKPDTRINFIGVSDVYRESIQDLYKVGTMQFFKWMPYQEALKLSKQSSILIYMGWKGYTGIVSGKIFDYLGLKRTILLAPSDNDVLEQLMIDTGAGTVADSVEEVTHFLETKYKEWKDNGRLVYGGDEEKIDEYTRETQAQKLVQIINSVI